MTQVRRFTHPLLALALIMTISACASHTPPTLSPAGVAAFNATKVVKALDVLRDTAVAANAQVPPLVTEDSTRAVVTYHRAAVTTIGATPSGWAPTVRIGLDAVAQALSPAERQQLAPYIALLKTLIAKVTQ